MTEPLSHAVVRFRHLSPLDLDACRSALASPRFCGYQYRSNREGTSNTFTLEVVTDRASERREVLALLATIVNGIAGVEVEHIQENQDPEYPRGFSPQQFEEMRQALTPGRFQEEYQVLFEAPNHETDTHQVDALVYAINSMQPMSTSQRPTERRLAILASSHQEAMLWCRQEGISHSRVSFLIHPDDVRGMGDRSHELIRVGSWRFSPLVQISGWIDLLRIAFPDWENSMEFSLDGAPANQITLLAGTYEWQGAISFGGLSAPKNGSDAAPKLRSCLTCAYFMNGYKPGELSICNAFHAIAATYTANSLENDCPDWEKR